MKEKILLVNRHLEKLKYVEGPRDRFWPKTALGRIKIHPKLECVPKICINHGGMLRGPLFISRVGPASQTCAVP
jgi:hypothetical protein